MSTHYEEEAEVEALRRWWGENWKALAAGLVLGLGGILGWQQWRSHRENHDTQGSRLFNELQQAVQQQKNDSVQSLAAKLIENYADTPYAADAQLLLAAVAVGQGRYDDARGRLEWVVKNGPDAGSRALARLRLARVLWQLNQPDEALAQLRNPPSPFAALYAELRGDILLDQGHRAQAAAAYREALAALPASSPARDGLQRKLDDLADVAKPAAPATAASSAGRS